MAENVASDKTLKLLGKIKSKQWKAMGETVIGLKELVEMGGVGILGNLQETLTLEMGKLFSPLKNEINDLITKAMEPFMPYVTGVMNEVMPFITRGMGYITAILTGKLDEWMAKETTTLQKDMDKWDGWIDDLRRHWQGLLYKWDKELRAFGKEWAKFWRSLGWK